MQAAYSVSLTQLDKAKKSYEKAFKESEKTLDNYHRADADLNLSRAEVEKARIVSQTKGQMCEEAKTEYANQLQKTNILQRNHFTELMPKVYSQLQEMEQRRIACLQNYMKQSALIQRDVFPIIDKCLEGILSAAETISPADDMLTMTDGYDYTGNFPPDDFPFEDLSDPQTAADNRSATGSTHLNYSHSMKSETLRGTLSVAKLRKRAGIFNIFGSNKSDDYAELPPNQRRKRLVAKVNEIQSQINQETGVRDGLLKLKAAYESNPAMGDPHSVDTQLTENSQKMEKLRKELKKVNKFLSEMENGKPSTPHVQKRSSNRNSVSEDSLSRSASDSSVRDNPTATANNTNNKTNNNTSNQLTPTSQRLNNLSPKHNHSPSLNTSQTDIRNSGRDSFPKSASPIPEIDSNGPNEQSPESGISTSHLSIPDAEFVDAEDRSGGGSSTVDAVDGSELDMPSLGRAKAIYPFEAQSEGSIRLEEGEELDVVELDQGDGWTRVRRLNGDEEGFVPTSYIEVEVANC